MKDGTKIARPPLLPLANPASALHLAEFLATFLHLQSIRFTPFSVVSMSNSDGLTRKGRPPKTDKSRSARSVLCKRQAYFEYLLLENNSETQFSNLRILDFQSRTKETFTVGFVLALFVLSITIHPDWTNQQHANHCLAGLPVLTQPPFNFQNDRAGKVKFNNHFTRLVLHLHKAKDPDSFLRSPAFARKTQSARQQPASDEPDLDELPVPADAPYQPLDMTPRELQNAGSSQTSFFKLVVAGTHAGHGGTVSSRLSEQLTVPSSWSIHL
jgi:hypothetical protein